jgi:hypothetical protein
MGNLSGKRWQGSHCAFFNLMGDPLVLKRCLDEVAALDRSDASPIANIRSQKAAVRFGEAIAFRKILENYQKAIHKWILLLRVFRFRNMNGLALD